MNDLAELLSPTWGSEQWILEGWQKLSDDEKKLIENRVHQMFQHGLPFELKHDKLLYVYTFSLLAQLEVLAIQVPLKFEARMSTPKYQKRMRTQLLDEIFHGIVFTKIVYALSAPLALPPAYSDSIEILCNFIRNEECPKVAIMLLNLIGEGWIEEIFYCLHKYNIAPAVFKTIIDDEHRHVGEAELYRDIGLPDLNVVQSKLRFLEDQLLSQVFLQYKYMVSFTTLLGAQGTADFMRSLHTKHTKQLKKINLKPSDQWNAFMQMAYEVLPKAYRYSRVHEEVEMTPIRRLFMTQWDEPTDPTMVGQFNINISCLDFFSKKYPPETITTLMLQAISMGLKQNESFRTFLSFNRMYKSSEAYVGLVVKLPECGDHMGAIVFENCHTLSVSALHAKICNILPMMVFCYKKREELEKRYPHLKQNAIKSLYEVTNDLYGYPLPGNSVVSLSNIGFCGYSQTKSPLRKNEAMKFTLLEVERRQVWNKRTQEFEVQDLLPVSISADHRIFDGNLPVPKITSQMFDLMFQKMQSELQQNHTEPKAQHLQEIKLIEQMITHNLELAYKTLAILQTLWLDFLDLEDLLNGDFMQTLAETDVINSAL